ncbi:uncharacterized protein LOC134180019 [Corticium candelabrum]|uniref:uncharacterized protein LOC134180019 n=1 Tax=Corticium candelabrum TaxID=121492 RepID=UPI002E25A7AA|nr:uncharacterized protein LOC134180019 [Corticium candelabrum]
MQSAASTLSLSNDKVSSSSESGDSDDPYDYNKCTKLPFPSDAMQSWKSLYRNQEMVDITLLIGGSKTEFKAHKLVLCAHSDVLKKMLTSPMKEAQENTIEFPEVDGTAFGALLEFFYTGNVPVDKSFICELIELCDYLQVTNLKQRCCKWLHENLVVEDACEYLMFSSKPSADEQLYKNCFQWIEDHAAIGVCTNGFAKHMTAKEVEKIAASDHLNLDEIQLFEGIKRWIEYDDSRHEDGVHLTKYLRLPMMNTRDLLGCVQSSGFVAPDAILKALTSLQQPLDCNPYEINSPYTELRVPSARLARSMPSFTWQLKRPTSSKDVSPAPTIFTHSNRAVLGRSERLLTSKPLPIPSCVHVQLTTKSTVNRRLTVGLFILPSAQASLQQNQLSLGRLRPQQMQQPVGPSGSALRCGVRLNDATLSMFHTFSSVSFPVGCIVALKFHITLQEVYIHLDGAVILRMPLILESCCSNLPLFGTPSGSSQVSASQRQQKILDKDGDNKKVFIEVAIEEIKDTATVSVKKDIATCCDDDLK